WNTQYLLRTSVQGEEGGTVVPGDSVWVDEGETVEVTAVHDADGGYVFSHWTGDIESNENPLIVNMDSPITIEAVFESATSVEAENMPLTYGLYQNYPNPFNPSTRIAYDIPETGLVRLEVFDLMGRKVCTLVNDMRQPGSYQAVWNGLDDRGLQAASGTYVYVMRCGDYQKRMKAVFLK
ncbi:T9SS type A sorting domain-containing protein, partial [bacterium]|nr:T9SS type A sorting domain-containing protein [bacterium]